MHQREPARFVGPFLAGALVALITLVLMGIFVRPFSPSANEASVFGCWLGDCNVDVNSYAPYCAMTVTPASINPGDSATLVWGGNLLSPYLTPLSIEVASSDSMTVTPNQTTTYSLFDHAGVYGYVRYWLYTLFGIPTPWPYCSATVTVANSPGAPTCLLSAFPQQIVRGNSSTLYYQIIGTVSSSNIQGVGSAPQSPPTTYSVSPSATTTYSLNVSGPGGNNKCTTEVDIIPPPQGPYLSIQVNPQRVISGGTILLAWQAYNVATCTVTDQTGTAVGSGLANPTPAPSFTLNTNTTYTLTCATMSNQILTQQATVKILPSVQEI